MLVCFYANMDYYLSEYIGIMERPQRTARDDIIIDEIYKNVHLYIFQRNYLAQWYHYVQQVDRQLAVVMGFHPRLGADSVFNKMDLYLLRSLIMQ